MSLPKFQDESRNFMQLQTTWASALDPLLASEITQGHQLDNVPLVVGTNVISHKLGSKLRGWMVVGVNGVVSVYDLQASNPMPDLTLKLVSNAVVNVNLWVY